MFVPQFVTFVKSYLPCHAELERSKYIDDSLPGITVKETWFDSNKGWLQEVKDVELFGELLDLERISVKINIPSAARDWG